MRAGRVGAVRLAPIAVCAALAGCGQSSSSHGPGSAELPLVSGASVVSQVRDCDRGTNAFCAVEVVVVDRRYRSSDELLASEHRHLRTLGWTGADGDAGNEHAADSPSHRLRLTYATPYQDLEGIDLGWIHRRRGIALALSRAIFDQSPAMSMMLEVGPS